MRTFHSFEDMALANEAPEPAPVLEAFSGSAIVRWYNTVKFGLKEKIAKQEANRNQEYAQLLRTYSNIWDTNSITGSMNAETVKLLKAAAEPYATMDWNEQKYFVGIVTSLDELLADQEAFPSGVDTEQNMPMAGGGGSLPPMGTDFGPARNLRPAWAVLKVALAALPVALSRCLTSKSLKATRAQALRRRSRLANLDPARYRRTSVARSHPLNL